MQDTGMLIHLVEGSLPQVDDIFDDNDNMGEFPSEGGVSNAVLARSLPSASSSNMAAGRVIAVSLEVSVPDISQFQLSSHLTDITSSLQPVVSSTLEQPGGILLDLTNNTTLDSNLTSIWSSEDVGAVLIISLMVPFILVSNIIVILCVIRFRRLHTPTNYFITSLAAVDIFVALATPFVVVVEVFRFRDVAAAGDVMLCLLPNRILMMGCGVSVLTLAAIAYDRHTALVSPLKYVNIMTTRRVTIMALLSWVYSVVIVWLPLMVGWYHVPSDISPCSSNLIQWKAPVLFLSAIFVPSCVAIMICYFRILMVARQHVKAIAAFEFAVHRRVRVKCLMRETKCLKTLGLIVGVFLVLWLPYLIVIFLKTVSSIKFDVWLQTYLILLAVFNSGINPWMYAFMNSELRAAFKRLFKEICGDRFCASAGRRSSVVSVVTSTPRLSLTDSRAVSIIPDPSLDYSRAVSIIPDPSLDLSTETLARRLQRCVERQPLPGVCELEHHDQAQLSQIATQSLSADWSQPEKQAASCPHLDTVDNSKTHRDTSLPRPRSTRFNHDLRELPHLDVLDDRDLITPGMNYQISEPVPCGRKTPDGLNTATSSRGNVTSSPSPSVTSVSWIQSCTSLLAQQAAQLTTLPPPSCPPYCVQTNQHTSSSLTPVSCPTATAQIHDHVISWPPSLCHLHCTDSKQPSSSHTRVADRPQTQDSGWSTQVSPITHLQHPCTCPRQSRDVFTDHRRQPSIESPQTSAQLRSCPAPSPQTSAHHTICPVPSPQTSAHHTICPAPCPQTSAHHTICPAPSPQTSAHHTICPVPSPQTSAHHTICPVPALSPSQTSAQPRSCPAPSPQTSAQPRSCPVPSPQTSAQPRSCPAPSPQTSAQLRSCPAPSPQTSAQCRNFPVPVLSPSQTSAHHTVCLVPALSPSQTSAQLRTCPVPSPPPPQTSAECSSCSLPAPYPPQTSAECSSCSLPAPYPPQTSAACRNSSLPAPQTSAACSKCPVPPPLRSPTRQFRALFTPVCAYNFLLPLCETLALDVISTASRLETCIDLALAACEHTMLIH